MDDSQAIAERIVEARTRAGLEQKELAASLGVTDRQVRNYENAKPVPYDKLADIAALTGVTREWLLSGDDPALTERVQMLEAVLEQIRPGWRELLRPPPGLERLGEDDPHSSADPDEPKTDQEDPPPPAR